MKRTLSLSALAVICLGAFASLGLGGSLHTAKSFQVTCATTATAITATDVDGFASVYCDNNSSTSVYLGGSDVGNSSTNICISTSSASCPRRDLPADYTIGALYCRVASGTQAIQCLAGK